MVKRGGPTERHRTLAERVKNAVSVFTKALEADPYAVEVRALYDEAWALSQKWRPLNEKRVDDPKYMAYRQSGEELFADMVSVPLNNIPTK